MCKKSQAKIQTISIGDVAYDMLLGWLYGFFQFVDVPLFCETGFSFNVLVQPAHSFPHGPLELQTQDCRIYVYSTHLKDLFWWNAQYMRELDKSSGVHHRNTFCQMPSQFNSVRLGNRSFIHSANVILHMFQVNVSPVSLLYCFDFLFYILVSFWKQKLKGNLKIFNWIIIGICIEKHSETPVNYRGYRIKEN